MITVIKNIKYNNLLLDTFPGIYCRSTKKYATRGVRNSHFDFKRSFLSETNNLI